MFPRIYHRGQIPRPYTLREMAQIASQIVNSGCFRSADKISKIVGSAICRHCIIIADPVLYLLDFGAQAVSLARSADLVHKTSEHLILLIVPDRNLLKITTGNGNADCPFLKRECRDRCCAVVDARMECHNSPDKSVHGHPNQV